MIAAEPPTTAADTATERTSPHFEAVQPTHGPSFTPSSPYDGTIDQQSIIAAVIAGQITTREAAVILGTSTDQVRALKSRAIKRAAKPPTSARTPKHSHAENTERAVSPVSPPSSESFEDAKQHTSARANDAQIIDNEEAFATNPPDVASETLDAIAQAMHTINDALGTETTLQSLQDGPPETLSEGGETGAETGATATANEGATRPPLDKRAIALANLAKANAANAQADRKKPESDEGSFEREELDSTRGLIKALATCIKTAESGRDAQAYSAALLNVADFRRRAAGKSSTLVKEAAPKGNGQRNALVVIQSAPPAPVARAGKPTPKIIDMESESLNDAPPALKAALSRAPAYVASL